MRKHTLRWLATTAVLFVATWTITGWSSLMELRHWREWEAVKLEAAEGELDGIRVRVREVTAAVVDNRPERGLVYVRIDVQGAPEKMAAWMVCHITLLSPSGQTWQSLYQHEVRGAIKILAPDGKDNGDCNLSDVNENQPTSFDLIYRLPSAAFDDLTLSVSGYGVRPAALRFPVKPEVRTFKAP